MSRFAPTRRRLGFLLAASALATAATAQVSTLSNPSGAGGEPAITAGTTGQYWRGDKTWQTLDKTAVGLANVTNTSDANKPVSTAQQTALDLKANLAGGNTFTGNQSVTGNIGATDGSLSVVMTNGIASLTTSPGAGTYSEIALKGNGGLLANGLDILAGGANTWLSADTFNFRNAAQTTSALTLTTASGTFNGTVAGSNLSGTNTGDQFTSIAQNTVLGRTAAGSGPASALTSIPTATMPALTGDVTTSAGAVATTIANNATTYAKFQQVAASSLVGNATGSLANATGITLAGGLGFSGSTLTAAGALTPTSVASSGAISGTSIAGTTTILSSGATSGIGYATGAGGAVTQGTSRTTTVVNNKACGAITMFSAAGSATWATFTVTDSAVAATDTIIANEKSGTNLYMLAVTSIGSGTFNLSFATTGGTATDAPVINYCVIKGVAA